MIKQYFDKIIHIDDNVLKIITTFINIIMLIIFILTLFTDSIKNEWYWLFITAYFLIDITNIMHYDYNGLNIKEAENITMRYKNITFLTLLISSLMYLAVIGFEIYNDSIRDNMYIISILYILLTISQILNTITKNNVRKEMIKIAEKKYKI